MNAKQKLVFGVVAFVVLLFLFSAASYEVRETEQVIITQFGKPVGEPVRDAGLHFKVPFMQKVNRVEKRVLAWDGPRTEMPTKDKLYISVDAYARWRVIEPLEYFRRLRDERSAQSRLDDVLGSEMRNAIAKHDLIEVIRTTQGRVPERAEAIEGIARGAPDKIGVLGPITKGRRKIEAEIHQAAKTKLAEFGIDLLDVRFKRINYNPSVVDKIYERMISERQQIASLFRSEGEGEAAKILGNRERDLNVIESESYRTVQELRGAADAKATEIYAAAYDSSPEARELYEFVKTMETYKKIVDENSTLVFTSASDLFRFLKSATGKPRAAGD